MDIYRTTQKAVSGTKLNANRGLVVSGTTTNQKAVTLFFYGATGGTYSTDMILPPYHAYFIPIRAWGISFSANGHNAFGVS